MTLFDKRNLPDIANVHILQLSLTAIDMLEHRQFNEYSIFVNRCFDTPSYLGVLELTVIILVSMLKRITFHLNEQNETNIYHTELFRRALTFSDVCGNVEKQNYALGRLL